MESAGKSQLLEVPVHVKFINSYGVDLGEVESTMKINFDFMSSSVNKIDVAIKQVQITDLEGSVTGIDLELAKERTNRKLNYRFGEVRTHMVIDKGLCIGADGLPARKIYQKKTIRYCEECIIETGINIEALKEYYGDNFIVDRHYGEGYTGIGFDDRDPLRDDEWETDCGGDMDFDMDIEEDTDSWILERRVHKWLVDASIEDLLIGTERLTDWFKGRRDIWDMFERSKVGPFIPEDYFYKYLDSVRVFEFDRFLKEIVPMRPNIYNYMNISPGDLIQSNQIDKFNKINNNLNDALINSRVNNKQNTKGNRSILDSSNYKYKEGKEVKNKNVKDSKINQNQNRNQNQNQNRKINRLKVQQ